MTDPTTAPVPTETVPTEPDPREVAWQDLRRNLRARGISCPDCQKIARDIVALMDLFNPPPPEPPAEKQKPILIGANAEVRIYPATPSPSGAGQGREVAPGVVIVDAPKPKK